MAIAFDAGSSGGVSGSGSLTISHTVGTGSDRCLVVMVQSIAIDNMSGGSATWNGTSMGSPVLSYWPSANAACYAWVLVAPASGTANVVITFNASDAYANATVFSFTGVNQTTPVSTTATYNDTFATSPRSLTITVPSNGAAVDHLYVGNGGTTMTPTGTGHTAVGSKMVNSSVWSLYGAYQLGSASSVGWTFSGSSVAAVHGAVALSPTTLTPTITAQPSNQTVTAGATASFGVTATSSGGALSYQWQRSTNSGGSWANVTTGTGGTSATYTTAATTVSGGSANNGDQYRVTVTDSNGNVTSTAASLTVNAAAATGYSMTGPSSGVVGSASSNFTVTLTPAGGTASATTITPSSGGGGGTFTPTTVSLSTGTPSATFTYTPASAGVKTISVTNSGSLTNPSNISFTASTASSKGGAVLALFTGKVL